MVNENDFGEKYLEKLEKEEKRKQKEKERSRGRKVYFREWSRKNKDRRGKRFINKKEAKIILKYLPNLKETKDLILKLNKLININCNQP